MEADLGMTEFVVKVTLLRLLDQAVDHPALEYRLRYLLLPHSPQEVDQEA